MVRNLKRSQECFLKNPLFEWKFHLLRCLKFWLIFNSKIANFCISLQNFDCLPICYCDWWQWSATSRPHRGHSDQVCKLHSKVLVSENFSLKTLCLKLFTEKISVFERCNEQVQTKKGKVYAIIACLSSFSDYLCLSSFLISLDWKCLLSIQSFLIAELDFLSECVPIGTAIDNSLNASSRCVHLSLMIATHCRLSTATWTVSACSKLWLD